MYGQCEITLTFICFYCHLSSQQTTNAFGGVRYVRGHHWKNPRSALLKLLGVPGDANVYQTRDPLARICDRLIYALKMLPNLQADVDGVVTAVFQAPLAQGMIRVTEALRRVIEVDNDDAVRCGELNKRRVALKVIKRRFNLGQYSEAVVCEEADLLTLSTGRTWNANIMFHCVEEVTNDQQGPVVVDEDWHALCQAIYSGEKVRHGGSCFR